MPQSHARFRKRPDHAIQAITASTLVLGSDRDVMLPEGAVALFRLLQHAQLAILPGVTHMEITSKTNILVPLIAELLRDPGTLLTRIKCERMSAKRDLLRPLVRRCRLYGGAADEAGVFVHGQTRRFDVAV